jgi:hypothetical protein
MLSRFRRSAAGVQDLADQVLAPGAFHEGGHAVLREVEAWDRAVEGVDDRDASADLLAFARACA